MLPKLTDHRDNRKAAVEAFWGLEQYWIYQTKVVKAGERPVVKKVPRQLEYYLKL